MPLPKAQASLLKRYVDSSTWIDGSLLTYPYRRKFSTKQLEVMHEVEHMYQPFNH